MTIFHLSSRSLRRPILFMSFAAAAVAVTTPARADKEDRQFWLNQEARIPLAATLMLEVDGSVRFREAQIGPTVYQARATLLRRVAPGVSIGAGVLWQGIGARDEYRTHIQLNIVDRVFQSRTRLERRVIEGAGEAGWRLRERLRIKAPLSAAKKWSALANVEVLFHLNRTRLDNVAGFSSVRLQGGMSRRISDLVSLDLVYQFQRQFIHDGPDNVSHAPILTLGFDF